MNFQKYLPKFFILVFTLAGLFSCSNSGFSAGSNQSSSSGNAGTPTDSNTPTNQDPSQYTPLKWETTVKESARWSLMIYQVLLTEEPLLIKENVSDMATFCPQYAHLNSLQKMNFWGQLISAIARFESNWKPTARYLETTMGLDPVTGQQVVSEGLLQLSYQDRLNHPGVCHFDWDTDKLLSPTDAKKSILDPFKNLECGIRILAQQIRSKNAISISSGAYWSVIKSNSSHQKINQIAAITKELTFCR